MAINFLQASKTYRKMIPEKVQQRRAVVAKYLNLDYVLPRGHNRLVLSDLHVRGFTDVTKNTIAADVETFRHAFEYLVGTAREREELLKQEQPWRKEIECFRVDGIERWEDLGLDPKIASPILVFTDMNKFRELMLERKAREASRKAAATIIPITAPPAPKIRRKRPTKQEMNRFRVILGELRFLFRSVGNEESLPLEFALQEIKPLVEKRISRMEKDPAFQLSDEIFRRATETTGSKFLVEGEDVRLRRKGRRVKKRGQT